MFMRLLKTSSVAFLCCTSGGALAVTGQHIAIEVKPLTTLIFNATAISKGGEGGLEIRFTENLNLTLQGGYVKITNSEEHIQEDLESMKDDENYYIDNLSITAGSAALTYYQQRMAGWYGGAGVALIKTEGRFGHRDLFNYVDFKQNTTAPMVHAGYKWMWNSGFFMRLGATAAAPGETKVECVTSRDGTAGEEDIKNLEEEDQTGKREATYGLDFGIGFAF